MTTGDGRELRVEWVGDPQGSPVFLLHGMPGSRVGPRPRGMVLYQRRTRLISYDRPGYGGSGRQRGRSVVDGVKDVVAVADALGVGRFAVVGRSAGAPHALACAALLPERVTRAAAMVGLAPRDADGLDWYAGMAGSNVADFRAAAVDPEGFARMLIPRSAEIRSDPARLIELLRAELTDDDLRVVSDLGMRSMLLRTYGEAVRRSPYGWIDDALALARPWGFEPAAIRVPVLLWHGRRDVFSPASHMEWLAGRIPGALAVLEPAAAHFAALRALPEVLRWLVDGDEGGAGGRRARAA
ncbi:alpha/beta fold hydrolase [Streptomyces sp. VRA16 Mangrove soil]|uniref:alpha/beta fold hydrolase n=1 Tax=Streptomyces sp. VRA16 Mangrove soil TaxID=2817434 RepID=UPI001A9F639A|nr:alpha/beta hydrolase [Streptomyces sp. VRA16 Mangrove soil]MBO1335092.1 alpha/beta hydrolase [Streptomyces sp. VRA16 Mangrove soil]